jgi:flagellar protein FliS
MYANNNGYNLYKNNSVNFASKEQLLLLLVDGAVKFSKMARQAIVDGNIAIANENLKKTQNIFYELIASFDISKAATLGTDLIRIYKYIINKLVEANAKKDVAIMDKVMPFIEEIRDMWHQAYKISKGMK